MRSVQEEEAKIGGSVWFLHIYSHKHNTHMTLSKPNHNPVLSLSCGNMGFKHAARKTYEAAFQLGIFTLAKIHDKGLLVQVRELELVFRGFGKGRDAITKVLLGPEGRALRNKVVRVSDATKLKFGGVRSKNVRRV